MDDDTDLVLCACGDLCCVSCRGHAFTLAPDKTGVTARCIACHFRDEHQQAELAVWEPTGRPM